ncbi:hypothetical protein AVDCRST_MAG84-3397 [uncultured Microcoleus sp.]|uniref:Uncharacterized protein n=1 Tax=uncultured Microcoleus sp. TaxID=259945 RepID=A0A6J4MHD6_9CYAN|nr:hypothetical protein AVDCRST_MAG84-3397 [uncultured Microcoleus sp.]
MIDLAEGSSATRTESGCNGWKKERRRKKESREHPDLG